MTTTPAIPRSRRILYTLAMTLAGLLVVEGLARVLEPHLFPYKRTIPLPAPMSPGSSKFKETVRELRRQNNLKPPVAPPIPLASDPARGWVLARNATAGTGNAHYSTNSLGMRGAEPSQLEPGDVRLFTMGDSSIFGALVGNDDVFSAVASQELSTRWKRKVVDVIGAVPGHDSSQSLKTLRLYGNVVHPSWVVIGNLWSDVYRGDGAHSINDDLAYVPPMRQRLRGYATYRLLWQFLSPWLQSRQVRWIASRDDIAPQKEGKSARVPLEDYVGNLKEMIKQSRALGARVAFVMLPAPMDFDQVPPPLAVQAYRLAMRTLASQIKAPLVDGPALFKSAGANAGYFFDQVHPTEEGHRLLGAALAQVLEPEGPPPAGTASYTTPQATIGGSTGGMPTVPGTAPGGPAGR